jgi:D-alanyl-D-alanine carboxypeptidase
MHEQSKTEEYTTPKTEMPVHDAKLSGGVEMIRYELDYKRISIVLFLFLVVGLLLFMLSEPREYTESDTMDKVVKEENIKAEIFVSAFKDIEIEGEAAFVWDVKGKKVLYSKNEEVQLPLASITKLMTAVVATKYINPEDTIVIQDKNLREEGDSGLFAFEEWNAKDLLDFTLMVSSNDGADVIASAAGAAKIVREGSQSDTPEDVFIEEMNSFAEELGLSQTFFLNETGLDSTKVTSGGYGSARDTALLMEYIVKNAPELLDLTVLQTKAIVSESNFIHNATNTNQNIGSIPGLIGSKTGFTDLAGGNLVIAFDAGISRPIIVSVLGSTLEGRFDDAEKLALAALFDITK